MNYEEKLHLMNEMKRKKIKQKDLAKLIQKSDAWVSVCLSDKNDFTEQQEKMVLEYVASK